MDVAKIGMSTDPVGRMHRLHRRYFEFFDLDRAVLLEVDSVRNARTIEAALKSKFSQATIAAPLTVADDAGGKREWFLGISNGATVALQRHAEANGYALHPSMAAWLRGQWRDSSAVLFDWSAQMLDRAELIHFNANDPDRNPYAQRLRKVFALCIAIDLPLENLVPNGSGDGIAILSIQIDKAGVPLNFWHSIQRPSQSMTSATAKLAR